MLEFLKRLGGVSAPLKSETQRERFERLVEELNEALDELADKPAVTIEPNSGHISFKMPEQFPDEALALPKPQDAPKESADEGETEDQTKDEQDKDSKAA